MRHTEEFATDELRQEEPEITEKLILAMEGILQMSEAQAKSVSAITDAISEIRYALERQGTAVHDLKNKLEELKSDQLEEPILSDIHEKIRNLSEAWNIMLSSSTMLEDRLTRLEASSDNMNQLMASMLERFDGDLHQLKMSVNNLIDRDEELKSDITQLQSIIEMNFDQIIAAIKENNNEELVEMINAARVAAQRASENAEEMKNVENILKKRIDYIFTSLNEKMDAATAFTNKKIDDINEAFHTSQLEDFEEHEKMNLALTQVQLKLNEIESLLNELKPKKRRTTARKRVARRRAPRPEGAIVDYAAIEEMIVNYTRENGRATIDAVRGHTGIGETTLRKILHDMVRKNMLVRQKQGKFVYYSVA